MSSTLGAFHASSSRVCWRRTHFSSIRLISNLMLSGLLRPSAGFGTGLDYFTSNYLEFLLFRALILLFLILMLLCSFLGKIVFAYFLLMLESVSITNVASNKYHFSQRICEIHNNLNNYNKFRLKK